MDSDTHSMANETLLWAFSDERHPHCDMHMSDFVAVATTSQIDEGSGAAFAVNGRMVAIFKVNGEFHAIDDACPHMGASLAAGHIENGSVTCPWHAWRFRVTDGAWCDNPKVKTDCFELRVEGDQIMVRVPPRGQPQDPGSRSTSDAD